MQYFTNDLWSKINSLSYQEKLNAKATWEQNREAYWKSFSSLINRISKKAYNNLSNKGFHDYELHDIRIIDHRRNSSNLIEVILQITDRDEMWQVKYKKITAIQVSYGLDNENITSGRGFDTWGYDELLPVDENILSHEILFASGATIKVCFKNENIFINKIHKTRNNSPA